MSKPWSLFAFAFAAALAGSMGCSSGDAESGRAGGGLSDRGPLEGPVDPSDDPLDEGGIITEKEDIIRLRAEAFKSGNQAYTNSDSPLIEDTSVSTVLQNKARLHWSAIQHTGFLASIPTYTGNLATNTGAFGPYLAPIELWKVNCPLPNPVSPRWSVNNRETDFSLPLATNTVTPRATLTQPIFPVTIPTGRPATPKNRYIIATWDEHIGGDTVSGGDNDPILTTDGVHEYYMRHPIVPDGGGSRIISAFMNRYGRLGIIRNQHDIWGFGSISEARGIDLSVLLEADGRFLPSTLTAPGTSSLFAGTLAYRIKASRNPFIPSFWPGSPSQPIGNAPITYGWSYDPETGERVGVAIHVAGELPICQVDLNISFDPWDSGNSPWRPRISNGRIEAPASRGTFPDSANILTNPEMFFDGDANKPFYPITYDFYGQCYTPVTTNPGRTTIGTFFHDTAYQANEAVIVARLKPYFNGALPSGTYRINIVAWQIFGGQCVPTRLPTATAITQTRYFHVWNEPGFFRP